MTQCTHPITEITWNNTKWSFQCAQMHSNVIRILQQNNVASLQGFFVVAITVRQLI